MNVVRDIVVLMCSLSLLFSLTTPTSVFRCNETNGDEIPLLIQGEVFAFRTSCPLHFGECVWNASIDIFPDGEYLITTPCGNTTMTIPAKREYYFHEIQLLSPVTGVFERTESLPVRVRVIDGTANLTGGTVAAYLFGKRYPMEEISPGVYGTNIEIPWDAPQGSVSLTIISRKTVSTGVEGGKRTTSVKIVPARMVLSFQKKPMRQGEEEIVLVSVSYPNGMPVNHSNVSCDVRVNGKSISSTFVPALSACHVFVTPETSFTTVKVSVNDTWGNSATMSEPFTVEFSLDFFLQQHREELLGGVFALLIGVFVFTNIIVPAQKKLQLNRRLATLVHLRAALEKDYFERGALRREEYEKFVQNIEHEKYEIEMALRTLQNTIGGRIIPTRKEETNQTHLLTKVKELIGGRTRRTSEKEGGEKTATPGDLFTIREAREKTQDASPSSHAPSQGEKEKQKNP